MSDLDLLGEWNGWRLRGRRLVSPDGKRITPEHLRGLLFRDDPELRRAGYESRRKAVADVRAKRYGPKVKVAVVDLTDYRENGVAAS